MKLFRPTGLTRTPKPRRSESHRKLSETLTPTLEGFRASTVRLLIFSMILQYHNAVLIPFYRFRAKDRIPRRTPCGHLAKVGVEGSNPFARSKKVKHHRDL